MDFIRTLIPAPYRLLLLLAVLLGIWLHGYYKGHQSNAVEIAALTAAGAAQDAQYRKLEKEVGDAMQALVGSYRAAAVERDRYWLRLQQARASRVPAVSAQPGSVNPDPRDRVAPSGGEGGGDVPELRDDLLRALEVGERLEATLGLCQAELRACAGLR
jgi:hypothetical protein